jgi:hypothetical protein
VSNSSSPLLLTKWPPTTFSSGTTFTFGAPKAEAPCTSGSSGITFGFAAPVTFQSHPTGQPPHEASLFFFFWKAPAAPSDTGGGGKKRTRTDGQVTKDEYYKSENKPSNPPTPGLFKRAPPEILARRKMLVRGRRKEQVSPCSFFFVMANRAKTAEVAALSKVGFKGGGLG